LTHFPLCSHLQYADLRRLVELKLESILDVDSTNRGTTDTGAKSSSAARIIAQAVKKQFEPKSSGMQEEQEKYMCKVKHNILRAARA
jgi:inactivated superfamily I helicase